MKRLHQTGSELERELVESASYDGLSAASRRRHLRRLGLGGGVLGLLGYFLGYVRHVSAAVAGASHSTLLLIGGLSLAAIAASGIAIQMSQRGAAPIALLPPTIQVQPDPAPAPEAPRELAPPLAAEAAPPAAGVVRNANDGGGTKAAKALGLERETKLLMRVHELMRQADVPAARAQLREYRSLFPRGQLQLEAEVVEVELIAASGAKQEAALRAKALLASRRAGPYEARLQAIEAAAGTHP